MSCAAVGQQCGSISPSGGLRLPPPSSEGGEGGEERRGGHRRALYPGSGGRAGARVAYELAPATAKPGNSRFAVGLAFTPYGVRPHLTLTGRYIRCKVHLWGRLGSLRVRPSRLAAFVLTLRSQKSSCPFSPTGRGHYRFPPALIPRPRCARNDRKVKRMAGAMSWVMARSIEQ